MSNNTLSLSSNALGYSAPSYNNLTNGSYPSTGGFTFTPNIKLKGEMTSKRARMHENPGAVVKDKLAKLDREKRSLNTNKKPNKVPVINLKLDPDINGCARKNIEAGKNIYKFFPKARYNDLDSLEKCAPKGSIHEYQCRSESHVDFQFYDPGYCEKQQSQPKNLNKCDQANLDYHGKNKGKYNDVDTAIECMPRYPGETFYSHIRSACSFLSNFINRDGTQLGSGIYCFSVHSNMPPRVGGKIEKFEAFIPATASGGKGR